MIGRICIFLNKICQFLNPFSCTGTEFNLASRIDIVLLHFAFSSYSHFLWKNGLVPKDYAGQLVIPLVSSLMVTDAAFILFLPRQRNLFGDLI